MVCINLARQDSGCTRRQIPRVEFTRGIIDRMPDYRRNGKADGRPTDVEVKNRYDGIGRLMHDFHCTKPEEMYYGILQETARNLKETGEGAAKVQSESERLIQQGDTAGNSTRHETRDTKGRRQGRA